MKLMVLFWLVICAFSCVKKAAPPPTRLYVKTSPTAASVSVDGGTAGKSDILLELQPGVHRVSITLTGYRGEERVVELRLSQITRLEIVLVQESATTQPARALPKKLPAGAVDLLALFDPAQGAIAGKWEFKNDGSLSSDDNEHARIQSSYRPPAEYDYEVEFTCEQAGANVVLLLVRDKDSFEYSLNASGNLARFEDINGHARNDSQVRMKALDTATHTCRVEVRNDAIRGFLDGKLQTQVPQGSRLTRNGRWNLKDNSVLGLGTWGGPVKFHSVTVTPAGA